MKNRKVIYIILLLLTLITITFIIVFTRKIYLMKINPVYEKVSIYNKLKSEKNKLTLDIKEERNKLEQLDNKSIENINEKQALEKKIYDYQIKTNGKIVYLTFDDGPSEYTKDILDILDKYNVKATFFVTCSSYLEQYSKIILEKGHTLALHTCTHKYNYIYSSEQNYYDDLNNISNLVENYTGVKSKFIRFPGGSSNTVSRINKGIMSRLTKSVQEKGYKYYDWNIDSNDAAGANTEQIYSNVVGNLENNKRTEAMILMHDTKSYTKDALESIIKDTLSMGYTFSNITEYTKEFHHMINN